jgi:hypothetical protein
MVRMGTYPDWLAWLAVIATLLLIAGTLGLAVAAVFQAPVLAWASAACGTLGAFGIYETLRHADALHL